MKQNYALALCLLFCGFGAQAQITIEAKDMVKKYHEYHLAYQDDSTFTFDATQGGKDATWDLSGLVSDGSPDTMIFDLPTTSEFKDSFPQSNLLLTQDSGFFSFIKVDQSGLEWQGIVFGEGDSAEIVHFTDPMKRLAVPMTEGSKHYDRGSFSFEFEFGFPPFTIKVTSTEILTRSYEVDGYGSLKMPNDSSYDVLRLKVTEIDTTINKGPSGDPEIEVYHSYYYEFWAKEYGIALARIEVDSADHSKAGFVEFLDLERTKVGIASKVQAEKNFVVFPNPATHQINIVHNGKVGSVSLFDVSGKEVLTQTGAVNMMNTSALKPGVYSLRALSHEGQLLDVERILIQ